MVWFYESFKQSARPGAFPKHLWFTQRWVNLWKRTDMTTSAKNAWTQNMDSAWTYSLGCWQNGSWARVRKQGVAHCGTMDLRTRRKRKLFFLWESWYRWPLYQWRNRNKWNKGFSSRPSPEGRSGTVLAVSWKRANSNISGLPASGPLCGLPGWLGAWLIHRGCRSPARSLTHRPRCRLSLGWSSSGGRRRVSTATGGLRPGPGGSGGASRRGRMCWIASVCCCTAENCWGKPLTVCRGCQSFHKGKARSQRSHAHTPTIGAWVIHERIFSVLEAQTLKTTIVSVIRGQETTTTRKTRTKRHLEKDAIVHDLLF